MTARDKTAWALNLIVPGAGLIVAGAVWLGVTASLFFAAFTHVAIDAWLWAPAAWPRGMAWLALLGTTAIWLATQRYLLVSLRRGSTQVSNPKLIDTVPPG